MKRAPSPGRSPDKVIGIRELSWTWPECQTLHQLSVATVMMNSYYPRTSVCNNKHLFWVTNLRASWAFLLVWARLIWAYSCICGQLAGQLGTGQLWMTSAGLTQLCSTWSLMLCWVSLALFMMTEQGPKRRSRNLQGLLKSRFGTGIWHFFFILLAKTRSKANPRVRMGRDFKVSGQRKRIQGGC